MLVRGQWRVFRQFWRDIRAQGADVLCFPERLPRVIRLAVYYIACPGPFGRGDCPATGPSPDELAARGLVRELPEGGWYAFNTMKVGGEVAALLSRARNPFRKLARPRPWSLPAKTEARA